MAMILINEKIDFDTVTAICSYLRRGFAILIKTDTQWGLMALDPMILYAIKRRPLDKKIVRLVPPTFKFIGLSLQQKMFVKKFWPGSVTMIKGGESYRLTRSNMINAILMAVDRPVFCTSANISGGDPIHTIDEAVSVFGHAIGDIVGVIPRRDEDKEWCDSLPSTIVDIDYWYIVRKGLKYEEVLDFIANTIIPSYKEIREEIKANYEKIIGANKQKDEGYNPYKGLPLISVSNNEDILKLREMNEAMTRKQTKFIHEVVDTFNKKDKIEDKQRSKQKARDAKEQANKSKKEKKLKKEKK